MSKIIDVSYAQGVIDWEKVKPNIDGAILRASATGWGDANQCFVDAQFERNYSECKRLDIPVGTYHYSAVDTVDGGKREATFFLDTIKGKQFELPVYYDVENKQRFGPLDKAAVTAIVMAFCEMVESAGYWTGVYANLDFLHNKLDYDQIKRFTLWLAQYNDHPTYENPFEMWQSTSTGHIDGIAGNVDMDECYKDFETPIKASHVNGWTDDSTPTQSVSAAPVCTASSAPTQSAQHGPNPTLVWDYRYDATIADLQRIINAKGHSLAVDGKAGNNTYSAVKGYTINQGDKGPLTRWVQQRLTSVGCPCGAIDSVAGPKTMAAIKSFQAYYGLGQGYLGGTDWYYLIR